MSAGIRCTWGPRKRAGMGARCERVCIGPVHACMGTLHASGRGDPERACAQGPVRACMETERAWGPGACVRVWGPRVRAGVGTRSEHACRARCVHAWKPSRRGGPVRACVHGPVRVCVGTPRASGHRDPVCACIETKWAWGPGASVRDGPWERAGVGTWCKQACVGPVHACVGPVRAWIQRARTRACRDLARTASSISIFTLFFSGLFSACTSQTSQ